MELKHLFRTNLRKRGWKDGNGQQQDLCVHEAQDHHGLEQWVGTGRGGGEPGLHG